MAELTTTLHLRLRSDIAGKANRDRRSLKHLGLFARLGRSGQRSFRRIEQSARHQHPQVPRHGRQVALSTTSKIAAGIGLASIVNLASQRQQQKAFLQATSGKSAKEIDAIYEKLTNNAIAAGVSIVIGQPQTDTPAHGWIDGLKAQGDTLFATPSEVSPSLASRTREGAPKCWQIFFALHLPTIPPLASGSMWAF